MAIRLTLDPGNGRLDVLLLTRLRESHPALSRATLKELFTQGCIKLDGRPAKPSDPAPARAAQIEIDADPSTLASPAASADPSLQIPILYEDAELLVLIKPSGVP